MKFIMFHEPHFEKWDYRNLDIGIGGSETHQIEMAWRLARRGHQVISHSPLPDDCIRNYMGVEWRDLDECDWSEDGIWLIYRRPSNVDNLKGQQAWLICQDIDYPDLNEERAEKFTKIIALTPSHAQYLAMAKPYLVDKLCISSNGIRMDVIREVEKEGIERNPHRVMFASSPDRGLLPSARSFQKAREYVPDLEFHAFYGFNNMDKIIFRDDKAYKFEQQYRKECMEAMELPGVTWHGRQPQHQLYREWLKTGVWLYQTNFVETACITAMEAQALGAIPITHPIGALIDNVQFGTFIEGDAFSNYNNAKYAAELVIMSNPELQAEIRPKMMDWARTKFNWERQVDTFEAWAMGYEDVKSQYNYQYKHAKGSILNVGCHTDSAKLKERLGAVNLDAFEKCPQTGQQIMADIFADAREKLPKGFDTVILGDILEHFDNVDCLKILRNAKDALNIGGQVVITCPDDSRETIQNSVFGGHKPMPLERLIHLIQASGLALEEVQYIDYTFCEGFGVVAKEHFEDDEYHFLEKMVYDGKGVNICEDRKSESYEDRKSEILQGGGA